MANATLRLQASRLSTVTCLPWKGYVTGGCKLSVAQYTARKRPDFVLAEVSLHTCVKSKYAALTEPPACTTNEPQAENNVLVWCDILLVALEYSMSESGVHGAVFTCIVTALLTVYYVDCGRVRCGSQKWDMEHAGNGPALFP
ncbi:hypothetical protein BKA93DRAFT_749489 [Sparassis latifolia]